MSNQTIYQNRKKAPQFLQILYSILRAQNHQLVISWSETGKQFQIKNPSEFQSSILTKYYKHSNLRSFIQKLNAYNFQKIYSQKYPQWYIYSHPNFQKNKYKELGNFQRKTNPKHSNSQNDIMSSSQIKSAKNHTSSIQKKFQYQKQSLEQEISELTQQLQAIKNTNSRLCQDNLFLQQKIPQLQQQNPMLQRVMYKMLTQSYRARYFSYSDIINNKLSKQRLLMSQFYLIQNSINQSCNQIIRQQQLQIINQNQLQESNSHKRIKIQQSVQIKLDKNNKINSTNQQNYQERQIQLYQGKKKHKNLKYRQIQVYQEQKKIQEQKAVQQSEIKIYNNLNIQDGKRSIKQNQSQFHPIISPQSKQSNKQPTDIYSTPQIYQPNLKTCVVQIKNKINSAFIKGNYQYQIISLINSKSLASQQ